MPKGKITRLGDPGNPYGKKVTAAQAAQSKRDSERTTPKRAARPSTPAEKPKASLLDRAKAAGSGKIKELNDRYGGGARKRRIDDAIEGRTLKRK